MRPSACCASVRRASPGPLPAAQVGRAAHAATTGRLDLVETQAAIARGQHRRLPDSQDVAGSRRAPTGRSADRASGHVRARYRDDAGPPDDEPLASPLRP